MRSRRGVTLIVLALLAAAGAATAIAQVGAGEGRIGPERKLVNSGRHLQPFGTLVGLGNFPTGAALTPNGRYYWTVSTGRGENDVRIVSVRSGRVLQTLRLPGSSGGIAMDPARARVFVAGVADSSGRPLQQTPVGTPGRKGDVIHVFSYNPHTGSAQHDGVIAVAPPSAAPQVQTFPPTNLGQKLSWPDRLAVSPDGRTLLVPLNVADHAAIVDVDSKRVRYVKTGAYPYGAAILRDGKTGLVSNETPGTVSVIDLAAARKIGDIQVGPHLSHPEAIAVDPKADRAYVAIANSDQVAVIDTATFKVHKTLSVGRPEGLGTSPVDVAVAPDARRLYVAEAGADEIAVFDLTSAELPLVGRIPTAQYPTDVEIADAKANPCLMRKGRRRAVRFPRCAKLLYVSGKGLGTGPNPQGPQPNSPNDSDAGINHTQYLPLLNLGAAGIADVPSDDRLRRLTPVADGQLKPSNAQQAPADTPLRPNGPIKHVFYIVRENRTYDQILGDDPRGDGDPKLALFGGDNTPNAHALAQRFPLLDHVYANSEASIDGHFWTSAAKVSDYVNKNWFQNYGGRGRPYDFGVYAVTWPANGFLFDQAERQHISWFNYGEAIAGVIPLFPDKDRTPSDLQGVTRKFLRSDLGTNGCYANNASIGEDAITGLEVYDSTVPLGAKPGATSRFSCFELRFTAQLAAGTVPTFNYFVLSNDHTETLSAGKRSPRAMIADNDEAIGRIVDTISHSSIWKESAIFIVEDDSQDGADHVDAHRIPAFAISPYAKQGAIVHTRYDFLSVIRSMELIMGMKPLGMFDALGVPMYDAFQGQPANAAPYDHMPTRIDKLERNPAAGPGARAAARLPRCLDCIAQRDMDRLLWKSVHGWHSAPPPPGPNAAGRDAAVLDHGGG